MIRQFVHKKSGAIMYIDDNSKDYKKYADSNEWETWFHMV